MASNFGDLTPPSSLNSQGTTLTPSDGDEGDDEESICLTSRSVCSELDQGAITFGECAPDDDIDKHSDAPMQENQGYDVSPWDYLPQSFADSLVESGLATEGNQLQWSGWHNVRHFTGGSNLCSFQCYAGPDKPMGSFVMQKVIVKADIFDTDSENILAQIGQGVQDAFLNDRDYEILEELAKQNEAFVRLVRCQENAPAFVYQPASKEGASGDIKLWGMYYAVSDINYCAVADDSVTTSEARICYGSCPADADALDNILAALAKLFAIQAGRPQVLDSMGMTIQTTQRLLELTAASHGYDIQLQLTISFSEADDEHFPPIGCALGKNEAKKAKKKTAKK